MELASCQNDRSPRHGDALFRGEAFSSVLLNPYLLGHT